MTELMAFIDKWKLYNVDVTICELIEAIGLWNTGTRYLYDSKNNFN